MTAPLCTRCHKEPPARGLPRCTPCDRKRAASTEHARKKRAAARAAQLLATPGRGAPTRCPARIGPGTCGGSIETTTNGDGRTVVRCTWCERQERGVCRFCSLPVVGTRRKALYCAGHREEVKQQQIRASAERHQEEYRVKARDYYRTNKAARQRSNEYKRAWRKANPDKVRKQKRREGLRQPKRRRDYAARYRAKHREYYRQRQLERYRQLHPPPQPKPCTECGALVPYEPPGKPYRRCDACCWPFELRRREAKRERIAQQLAAAAAAPPPAPVKPKRVRTPRQPARVNAAGERLCVGPFAAHGACDAVVRGRMKKCAACRAADRAAAAAALEPHIGRGRRTDRERARGGRAA